MRCHIRGLAERDEWCGRSANEAAFADLWYIFRRRAESEPGERLARQAMPRPTAPPSTRAQPACVDVSWPSGTPLPPVSIDQLFEPGVYANLQRSIHETSASLWRWRRSAYDAERSGALSRRTGKSVYR